MYRLWWQQRGNILNQLQKSMDTVNKKDILFTVQQMTGLRVLEFSLCKHKCLQWWTQQSLPQPNWLHPGAKSDLIGNQDSNKDISRHRCQEWSQHGYDEL